MAADDDLSRSVRAARVAGWITGLALGALLWAVMLGIKPW